MSLLRLALVLQDPIYLLSFTSASNRKGQGLNLGSCAGQAWAVSLSYKHRQLLHHPAQILVGALAAAVQGLIWPKGFQIPSQLSALSLGALGNKPVSVCTVPLSCDPPQTTKGIPVNTPVDSCLAAYQICCFWAIGPSVPG